VYLCACAFVLRKRGGVMLCLFLSSHAEFFHMRMVCVYVCVCVLQVLRKDLTCVHVCVRACARENRFLPSAQSYTVYQMVWTHVIPLGICQLLMDLDKSSITSTLEVPLHATPDPLHPTPYTHTTMRPLLVEITIQPHIAYAMCEDQCTCTFVSARGRVRV
jgi:hypothetical protein